MEENGLSEILQIRRDKLQKLKEKGMDPFKIEKFERTAYSETIKKSFADYEGKSVRMAGRIMAKRGMGKVSFVDIVDKEGRIQLFVKKDLLGEENFEIFQMYDIGDIIGVVGEVFMTRKGEISIKVAEMSLLTKSLQVLPEKWHGLKDPDLRYRQRYVVLIVNPEVKEAFIIRSKVIKAIKEYLDERDYLEVDTPILNTIPGGAVAKPFVTHHNSLDIDMYMRIANELYLKRLIVGGFDRVYEMGRMFRNEGMSIKHNPEYTSIELYAAYEDYQYMMELTENIVAYCAEKVLGTTKVNYQGREIDFTPPWRRISMTEAVKQYTGVDFSDMDFDKALAAAKELHIEVKEGMAKGHIINEAFEEYVEEHLIQPTFVTHHPVEVSPLSKRNPDNPEITNRFEAFVNTWEIANAFSELNDPIDQRGRFEEQLKQRELGDDEAHRMDEDFLRALEVGMPPTGGLGIGVDRVLMLLTNASSIRDVILFPTMKPLKKE